VDEQQEGGEGGAGGEGGRGAEPRQPQVGGHREQCKAEADLEVEEAQEQRRAPGRRGEAHLPPVPAAEHGPVERRGPERGQDQCPEQEERRQHGGRQGGAQDRRHDVNADVSRGVGPIHGVEARHGRRSGAPGQQPDAREVVWVVQQGRHPYRQHGRREQREGGEQKQAGKLDGGVGYAHAAPERARPGKDRRRPGDPDAQN
jgi:hypothetical protein